MIHTAEIRGVKDIENLQVRGAKICQLWSCERTAGFLREAEPAELKIAAHCELTVPRDIIQCDTQRGVNSLARRSLGS